MITSLRQNTGISKNILVKSTLTIRFFLTAVLFVQHLTLQILQMYAYSYKQLAANEYMTLDLCFTSILQTNYKN